MYHRRTQLVLICLILLFCLASASWACEGCANFEAISNGQNVKTVQASFSWSVLFLLFMPFVLMGWLLQVMVKACQAADAKSRRHSQ